MSSTTEINFNPFILRFVEMFENSSFLFPKTIGGDANATDLVKQIIPFDLPIAQDVPEGEGPPHIFVREAPNPIVKVEQSGRDTRSVKGARQFTLEFWAVLVVNEPIFEDSQKARFNIAQAITQTIGTNKQMLDKNGLNPLAMEMDGDPIQTPFTLLQTDEKDVQAKTVVIRPKVMVTLRP